MGLRNKVFRLPKKAEVKIETLDGEFWGVTIKSGKREWGGDIDLHDAVENALQYAMVDGKMYLTVDHERLRLPGITFQAARV